jgi:hypothetical protein
VELSLADAHVPVIHDDRGHGHVLVERSAVHKLVQAEVAEDVLAEVKAVAMGRHRLEVCGRTTLSMLGPGWACRPTPPPTSIKASPNKSFFSATVNFHSVGPVGSSVTTGPMWLFWLLQLVKVKRIFGGKLKFSALMQLIISTTSKDASGRSRNRRLRSDDSSYVMKHLQIYFWS